MYCNDSWTNTAQYYFSSLVRVQKCLCGLWAINYFLPLQTISHRINVRNLSLLWCGIRKISFKRATILIHTVQTFRAQMFLASYTWSNQHFIQYLPDTMLFPGTNSSDDASKITKIITASLWAILHIFITSAFPSSFLHTTNAESN